MAVFRFRRVGKTRVEHIDARASSAEHAKKCSLDRQGPDALMHGSLSAVWLTVSPTTPSLQISNKHLQCAMRRRLGIAVHFEGEDLHGHRCFTTNLGGRLNGRHNTVVAAWRQVLVEAGGSVPDRNVERMLRMTNVPVPPGDERRLDLIVPGLNVHRGLPLFIDVTVVTPLSATGAPRPGTSNQGGRLLVQAQDDNDGDYHEVLESGLGSLLSLGCEVYGRWSKQCVDLVPALARERSRGMRPRIRRGMALSLQHRWWGILGIALQKAVAHMVLDADAAGDLVQTMLEPVPCMGDIAM